jgi:hypothetical protein
MLFAVEWIELEIIISNKEIKDQKDKETMFSLICGR